MISCELQYDRSFLDSIPYIRFENGNWVNPVMGSHKNISPKRVDIRRKRAKFAKQSQKRNRL